MKRILVLAHREELIYQAVGHARNAGLEAGIEMGSHRASGEDVVVSTVQTQVSRSKCRSCRGSGCVQCDGQGRYRRFETFDPHQFGLVIVDEAHHAAADTYRLVLSWYQQNPNLKVLLTTATPKRADGVGMHNVCDSVAYEMDIRDAIKDGWLVPIRNRFVEVASLDLSDVGTKAGGDLKDGEQERAWLGDDDEEEQTLLHSICKPCLNEAKGQSVLVFASGVDHAEKLTAAFNAYDGVRAECVLGKTDKIERKQIVDRYKRSETQILVGCGVFTEGFDAPGTSVVAICRKTNSLALFCQMIGRVTRPLKGVVDGPETAEARHQAIADSDKPYALVLDFVGNSGEHKLITVADVLAGEDADPIDLEAAIADAKTSGDEVDIEEQIEKAKQAREAKEEREKREAEERENRQLVASRKRAESAQYTATDIDLFDGGSFDPFVDYDPGPWQATQKQVNLLIKLGVSSATATAYSKGQAGKVITEMKNRSGGDAILSFGKHAGKKLRDAPRGYVDWMVKNQIGGNVWQDNIRKMRAES